MDGEETEWSLEHLDLADQDAAYSSKSPHSSIVERQAHQQIKNWWFRLVAKPKPKSNPKTSPFMRLPAEIRLQIYTYLVSNVTVERPRHRKRKRAPLRADGSKCCVSLLRVNRRIYEELYREWYCRVPFRIDIKLGWLKYLNLSTRDKRELDDLPSAFLTHPKLAIRIKWEPKALKSTRKNDVELLTRLAWHLDMRRRLQHHLDTSYSRYECMIQELEFQFLIPNLTEMRHTHKKHWKGPTGIWGLLAPYLEPLRHMTGQRRVRIEIGERSPLKNRGLLQEQQAEALLDAYHWTVAREYAARLAAHMMSRYVAGVVW